MLFPPAFSAPRWAAASMPYAPPPTTMPPRSAAPFAARNVQSRSVLASISSPLTLQGVLNTEVGLALELMFGALPPERWAAVPAVSYAVASELTRAPVGGLL
jgi:hypothetical protein